MSIETLLSLLGWAAFINYSVLCIWFLVFVLAHDRMYALNHKWFNVSPQAFDAIHYAALVFYKLCVFLFLLGPYIALRIVS